MRIIYGKSVYETNEAWVEPYLIGWSLYFRVNGIEKMICLPNTTYEKEENYGGIKVNICDDREKHVSQEVLKDMCETILLCLLQND